MGHNLLPQGMRRDGKRWDSGRCILEDEDLENALNPSYDFKYISE